jgi:ketosteroid isomerase-like protein
MGNMQTESGLPHPLPSFLRAWETRDLDALVAHWSADCTLIDPADPLTEAGTVHGREGMRQYYERLWTEIPDARLQGVCAAQDAHGLAWIWLFTGSSGGKPWQAAGASYFRLAKDGLITSDHAVWDSTIIAPS